MDLGTFRKLTKDLPDNAMLVTPTFVDCYTEVEACVCNTLVNLSMCGMKHNAFRDLGVNLPDDEHHPTIVLYEIKDK